MITVNDFIERAYPDRGDAEEIRRAIVKEISETQRLSPARKVASEYYRTQAVADRVVQEIVMRDERVTHPDVVEKMPLVFPEEDLGRVGDYRYQLGGPSDAEHLHLGKLEFELVGLNDDGTCVTTWRQVDSLTFPESDLGNVERALRRMVWSLDGEDTELSGDNRGL